MIDSAYRYEFNCDIPLEDIEASLVLALLGTEALHGETTVQLTPCHALELEKRICVINADTAVGRDLNKLFAGFLRREFGPASFKVRRIVDAAAASAA